MREFRRRGEEWLVWDTYPTAAERLTGRIGVAPGFADGWLTFTSGNHKLRLAPAPRDWADAADEELVTLLERATPVGARTM